VTAGRGQQEGAVEGLAQLLATPGVEEVLDLRSRFGFMAFHGGGLEEVTDVVAGGAASAAGASYYGVLHPRDLDVHLPSTRFGPDGSPRLASFLAHVDVVVTIHGYGRRGRWTTLLAGGSNRVLAEHLAAHLRPALPGYEVVTDLDGIPEGLRGLHPANPVNLPRGGGVQLELPPRVRGRTPRSPPAGADGLAAPTRDLITALASAARSWPPSGDR
jgi:phage replication-related protein YjqB (UPF0714/DUF867 family)